jgi:hypothetical protein
MAKLNRKGSVWAKMAGYAGGGEPDDQEEADEEMQPAEAYPVVTPGEGMRELASRMAQGVQRQPDEAATTQPVIPPGGQVPGSSKDNVLNVREKLQEFLAKQAGGSDKMQELADLYQKQLAERGRRPNLSGSNALVDHFYGTNLSKVYGKPPTADEQTQALMAAQEAVNKSRQPVTSDLLKEYGADNNAVIKEQAGYYRGLAGNERETARQIKEQNNLLNRMHDDMFFKRGTNPQVSQSINKLQRATSAIALMDQLPPDGPIPGELSNIASAVAGLATGGNVVTNEKMREILPKNVDLTIAGIKQWLTSEPQGADQQKFLQRFRREIDGEARAAHNTLSRYQDAQADSYMGRVPETMHQQLRKAGQNFLDHSYYNPDNPRAYLGPQSAGAAGGEAASSAPPVQGAKPIVNKKTGEKAWLMPDGSRKPRK